jgi:hypothetical protein
MRIVILFVFTLSLPIFASIDRTRLQMELDYLQAEASEKENQKTVITKNLKFKRNVNKSEVLSLEKEFDSVKTQYSAPRRNEPTKDDEGFIESDQPKSQVRMNGLVPKGLFKE